MLVALVILLIFAAAAVAVGVVVYLVQAAVRSSIEQDVARHKADLAAHQASLLTRMRREIEAAAPSARSASAAPPASAGPAAVAGVNALRLKAAQQEEARLRSECEVRGAFSIDAEHVDAAAQAVQELEQVLKRARGPWTQTAVRWTRLILLRLRMLIDDWSSGSDIPSYLFALFAGVAIFCLMLLFGAMLDVPGSVTLAAAAVAGLIAFFSLAGFTATLSMTSAREDYDQLRAAEVHRQRAVAEGTARLQEAAARLSQFENLWQLREQYEAYRRQVEHLEAFFKNRRNQLLLRDWRHLRGIAFEQFLVEVFEALGFVVETTKASGDQGVDLIAMRDELRIAIQAKGYGGSVGNDSVQQAYTGMAFYRCNRCVVVTNSEFTRAAVEVADRVSCILIDRDRLPQLIAGQVF
jgi:hypothetical protein